MPPQEQPPIGTHGLGTAQTHESKDWGETLERDTDVKADHVDRKTPEVGHQQI